MTLHDRLISAATEYDRKQSTRKGYNPYALAHYFNAIADIDADILKGIPVRRAVLSHTMDRLAMALLKGIGEPAITLDEAKGRF